MDAIEVTSIHKEKKEKKTNTDHESVVSPAAKLHGAVLIIEGEPGDVNFTSAFKYARGDIITAAVVANHHIGLEGVIEALVSTEKNTKRKQMISKSEHESIP